MAENECCYTCKQYRRVEVDGKIVDGKKAGGCRLHGGLIGMGIPSKAKLSPIVAHKTSLRSLRVTKTGAATAYCNA